MITKKNVNFIFFLYLSVHIFIWTIIPTFTNVNLPLDTIEALAWASNLDWGFNKHPPVSAFMVWLVYSFFGSNDFAYYMLSQICILIGFFFVWKLAKEFLKDSLLPLLSVLILESIVFFNYTTPEFNVYVCQIPFKSLTIYFFWKSINKNDSMSWFFTSLFAAIGFLTHYSFIFLILALVIFFLFFYSHKMDMLKNFLFSSIIFLLICSPHFIWLYDNNFITLKYAIGRTGLENKNFLDHFSNPLLFLSKQIGMMGLFILIFLSIYSFDKKKSNIFKKDSKKIFLLSITILPIIIIFFISFFTGAKIRTMWMSSFYLYNGLLVFYFFKEKIKAQKIVNFLYIFVFIFLLSPITYAYVSLSNDFKRTDYPGKEIARLVQNKWDKNFNNEIKLVIGDEWSAGNLSYHLSSRPIWVNVLKDYKTILKQDDGVIYTGNPKILKKICPGVFGKINPVGYCMIGKK